MEIYDDDSATVSEKVWDVELECPYFPSGLSIRGKALASGSIVGRDFTVVLIVMMSYGLDRVLAGIMPRLGGKLTACHSSTIPSCRSWSSP